MHELRNISVLAIRSLQFIVDIGVQVKLFYDWILVAGISGINSSNEDWKRERSMFVEIESLTPKLQELINEEPRNQGEGRPRGIERQKEALQMRLLTRLLNPQTLVAAVTESSGLIKRFMFSS